MPHLSFIARKPEPLGTEFKNLVDGLTGEMLWMEVQEGKDRMKLKPHQNLGSTAACVLRGVETTCNFSTFPNLPSDTANSKRLYFGDSWFGSVKATLAVSKAGHHACFMVKTAHSKLPKTYLEETMKDFPGGTWITMETEVDGVCLVCIGYKYNKKKVLTFVLTKGAGSSKPGEPYEARFPDKFGNVCVRHVARPEVISLYFQVSNKVDLHNQARQYELKLEKKWVTPNPYFRLYTTLIGITVTDAWKCLRTKNKLFETITGFSNVLCSDIIDTANGMQSTTLPQVTITNSTESLSSVTNGPIMYAHTRLFLKNKKQVRCIWCSRVNLVEKKTTMKCLECDVGFCRDGSCWSHHVALGGIPRAPKKGTKKRKLSESIHQQGL